MEWDRAAWQEYATNENRGRLFEAVQRDGLFILLPDDYTLQLDIDNEEDYAVFRSQLSLLNIKFPMKGSVVKDTPSKGGLPKRHITVKFDRKLSLWQKIAFQACLGSDRKRELLNAARVEAEVEDPIAFFEKGDDEGINEKKKAYVESEGRAQ